MDSRRDRRSRHPCLRHHPRHREAQTTSSPNRQYPPPLPPPPPPPRCRLQQRTGGLLRRVHHTTSPRPLTTTLAPPRRPLIDQALPLSPLPQQPPCILLRGTNKVVQVRVQVQVQWGSIPLSRPLLLLMGSSLERAPSHQATVITIRPPPCSTRVTPHRTGWGEVG